MQVLVVAVQNAVLLKMQDLGVATQQLPCSSARIGGCLRHGRLRRHLRDRSRTRLPHRSNPGQGPGIWVLQEVACNPQTIDPGVIAQLKSTAKRAVLLHQVHRRGHPCDPGLSSWWLCPSHSWPSSWSWLLPEVELRKTVQTVDVGEVNGLPDHRTSLQEIELALHPVVPTGRTWGGAVLHAGAAGGHRSAPRPRPPAWLLYRLADQPACTVNDVAKRLEGGRSN